LRTPAYRLHKPTGQAVVTLNGRDNYLGAFGTPTSRAEYDRLIAEWLANERRPVPGANNAGPADLTVNELLVAYLRFADGYYRKNGQPTAEPANIRFAIRPLRILYGHTLARDFGPLALKTVRDKLIASDLCRNEVNKRVGKIVRVFKWAVENEIVPPNVHHGLKAVSGLRKGRSAARESAPVRPVPDAFVDAIRPFVAPQVWAMVELQRLTGMRSGEVTTMRGCDLNTGASVWIYTPESHKTEHHDRTRAIFLGPRAQDVIRPWLTTNLEAYLFSPRAAVEERRQEMRLRRKSPVPPSQRNRKKRRPRKRPGERYDSNSYRRAITYACDKAGIPPWHPHRLRHSVATRLRRDYGLDTARTVLGHASPMVTAMYAELDSEKARKVMEMVG
jgi:integrase